MLVIFFELDGMDVSILTTIIWLLQAWVAYAVIALLVAAMFGGSSGLSGGAMGMIMGGLGGGGQGTLRDTSPAGRMNVRAERYKIAANAFEAKEWLAGAETRTIWGLDRAQSVAAIDGLYDAGSPEVYVAEVHQFGPKEVADKVVADLPDDQPTRDKIVAVQMESFKTRDLVPRDHGTGQEFVILDYDGNDD
jgi:hypothetical protein